MQPSRTAVPRLGGHILADALATQGVDTVFGVPGESYLAVLDALVPALATLYRVAVVFDKSTQRRLDTTPRALQERFGAAVEVHVAAAARGADHTFLRYADGPTSYVVTNDRLRDFTDLAVVKDGRVLRYNLLDRMIELPALDIATRFQNDGELPTLER